MDCMFADRKQELLHQLGQDVAFNALIDLLRSEGLEGLTMQKLASQAGMATGSLYKYFKSKEELLTYADQRLFTMFLDEVGQIDAVLAADEKLCRYTRILLGFCLRHTGTYVILERARLSGMLDKEQEKQQKDIAVEGVRAIVRQGIDSGLFRPLDTDTAARLYLSLIMGYFHVQIDYRAIELEEAVGSIHDLTMRYLKP